MGPTSGLAECSTRHSQTQETRLQGRAVETGGKKSEDLTFDEVSRG